LEGSEAEDGLSLGALGAFVNEFRGALRDFDRASRAERTKRGGHPTSREELVTSFRLVGYTRGSAILELEAYAPPTAAPEQEVLEDVETIALNNLRSLISALATEDEPVDQAVVEYVDAARKTLGENGQIKIEVSGRKKRAITIDDRRVEQLHHRVRKYAAGTQTVSGRLHAIDLEPDQVRIRTAQGVDWICKYPADKESTVTELVGSIVWARGPGQLQSGKLGRLTIEEIHPLHEFEQSELFVESVKVEELAAKAESRGLQSIVPDDATDDEVDSFLEALDSS
jgi:hypothetical protein